MWAGLLASIFSLNSIASLTWSCETWERGRKAAGGQGATRLRPRGSGQSAIQVSVPTRQLLAVVGMRRCIVSYALAI